MELAEFVECTDSMQVAGPASSCLDYMRVGGQGGLFCVSA